jgi:hypothetical protein
MASLFRATSSYDQRSNAAFIDWRSPSRKSGLMSRSKLIGSSVTRAILDPAGVGRLVAMSFRPAARLRGNETGKEAM